MTGDKAIRVLTAAVVLAVAAFAAVVSYSHIYDFGRAHGQSGAGRTGGRKSKLNGAKAATGPDGNRLQTVTEIAQTVGIHRTTVYDYLNRDS